MSNKPFLLVIIIGVLVASGCNGIAPVGQSTVGVTESASKTEVATTENVRAAGELTTGTPTSEDGVPDLIKAVEPECRKNDPPQTVYHLLPQPREGEWVKGSEDAYVTLIEYGDFQ